MAKRGYLYSIVIFVISVLLLVGCGSEKPATLGSESNETMENQMEPAEPAESVRPVVSTEPVTIELYALNLALAEEDFNNYFFNPIKAKYPHITLELITGVQTAELLIAGSTFPDIVFTSMPNIGHLRDIEIADDLGTFLHKFNMPLNKYDDSVMTGIREYGDDGNIYALPFTRNFAALFYNKDLFERFGVPFPVDGMTWEETIDVAHRMARTVDGVRYRGFQANSVKNLGSQMSLPLVDPVTFMPVINSEGWKIVFQTLKDMYAGDEEPVINFARNEFLIEQNLAMTEDWGVGMLSNMTQAFKGGVTFDWDMVSLPTFEQAPGTERGLDVQVFVLSNQSKHSDQAYQVIEYVTGEDGQLIATQSGRGLTTLNDPKVQSSFAANSSVFDGKNIEGVFKNKTAVNPPATKYDSYALNELNAVIKSVILGDVDVNTALRSASEAAEKKIKEKMAE